MYVRWIRVVESNTHLSIQAGTAVFIARSVGILTEQHGPAACMTGQQLDAMTDAEIDALPELPVVVARCSPETKVKMVDALYRRGMLLVALMAHYTSSTRA